jgi:hypothetical protein
LKDEWNAWIRITQSKAHTGFDLLLLLLLLLDGLILRSSRIILDYIIEVAMCEASLEDSLTRPNNALLLLLPMMEVVVMEVVVVVLLLVTTVVVLHGGSEAQRL